MNHPVPVPPNKPAHAPVGLLGLAVLTSLLGLAACNNRQSVIVPNRVLDRPTDMVLACMRRDETTGAISPTSIDLCAQAACEDLRLIGFVANSERDSIAMFSKCANSVLDMDIAVSGAQLIDAGKVPSSMTITTGTATGCFAVSANLGSCDLSLLDVPGLSAYAYDDVPARDPSELVTGITPTRGDGTPLGARPGQVLAVPPELSNSLLFGDLEDTGGDETTGAGTTGDDTAGVAVTTCDAERPGSVYVTFPSCQLIAEVDLRTHRILQSRQFERDPDSGVITVTDPGVDPECPIDCPELFSGDPEALKNAPAGEVDGVYPSAITMVSPPIDPQDAADALVVDDALYIGGLGADTLFELRYDGRRWRSDELQLELQDASGISVIRATPPMEIRPSESNTGDESYHQFLYIVAGDGSTRVVRREFDANRTSIGRECDTQVDPSVVLETACYPAEFPGENPPDRRPFARGPGIRGPNGSLITDWAFQKIYSTSDTFSSAPSSPFGKPGVTGVGTTSFGRLVFVNFNQFNTAADGLKMGNQRVSINVDRLGLTDTSIQPHMLWPTIDPRQDDPDPAGLPRMEDAEPQRNAPGNGDGADALKALAPALRRIDLAYAELGFACKYLEDQIDEETGKPTEMSRMDDVGCQEDTADDTASCGKDDRCHTADHPLLTPRFLAAQGDDLGNPEAGESGVDALYVNEVVRAVVRDYRSFLSASWAVIWEGPIPGTESSTGQLVCENPGWMQGTCLSTEPGDTRIVDATARFCDAGVLAGDKFQLYGCAADADCGVGQYCLVDPRSRTTTGAPGMCVSQTAYLNEDHLLQVCQDLLYDPCGSPVREYLITHAFQSELWLQSLDRSPTAYLMYRDAEGVSQEDVCGGQYLRGLPEDSDEPSKVPVACEAPLLCGPEQPDNGCESHDDCLQLIPEDAAPEDTYPLCVDGLCRRPCGEGEECILRRLPGPECVQELVRYLVLARNSFVVKGPGAYEFLDQRVRADANGECYEDPTVSNLMTSRIRLGADEADTRNNSVWPIPSCPPGSEKPGAEDPNPCFIDTPRPASLQNDDPLGLFHNFSYGYYPNPRTVPAIRYSNPMMSLVLDLTSLNGLIEPVPGTEKAWQPEFAEFRRARIPRAYNESFGTLSGYNPYDVGVVTSAIALVGPTRIINAPEAATVFVVDTAGGTGTSGVRGQVVRVNLAGGQVTPDEKFLVH